MVGCAGVAPGVLLENTLRPARIICLEGLNLREPLPQFRVDWVLETPLARDLLEGRVKSEEPRVIEQPDVILRLGKA